MKYDELGCLIREAEEFPASYGDSCAETCRALVLGAKRGDWNEFVTRKGYVRHPLLTNLEGWNEEDFSNDQLAPLLMAIKLDGWSFFRRDSGRHIAGTNTLLNPATWALTRGHYRLLSLFNLFQGLLLSLPYRWQDKGGFVSTEGESADWLNYVVTYVFLKRSGRWVTLLHSKERCLEKVRHYYQGGTDAEPNSDWLLKLYEEALK